MAEQEKKTLVLLPVFAEVINDTSKTDQEKFTFILDNTIGHYNSNNLGRRATGGCGYNAKSVNKTSKETEGCAIGRMFDEPSKNILAIKGGSWMNIVFKNKHEETEDDIVIPEFMVNHVNFFMALQRLHDTPNFWNVDGISESGLKNVDIIKENYILVK